MPFQSVFLGNNEGWRGTRGRGRLNVVGFKELANFSFYFGGLFGSYEIGGVHWVELHPE
jgi:hypothetical protein